MKAYPINELERLTGVKAHTIRIWEKRYGLIKPHRTTTNRRYYNDDQVRKLLNVSTLLAQGQKISRIASLSEQQLFNEVEQEMRHDNPDYIITGYINDLVKSMITFDEPAFEKIFSAAVTRFSMVDAMLNVIYPFLHKTGILWSVDKALPAQEHFSSNIIRRKLMAAIDGLMPPAGSTKKFLLFLPESEWHEIGLLFANYIIRSRGHETIYLGQNVPFENVEKTINSTNTTCMLTFYIATRPAEEIKKEINAFAGITPRVQLLVAGNTELFTGNKAKPKNTTYLTGVPDLLPLL